MVLIIEYSEMANFSAQPVNILRTIPGFNTDEDEQSASDIILMATFSDD